MTLPPVRASDWVGWVWPVPLAEGRVPTITQEWKPGHDPTIGTASGLASNHLGVDIMYDKIASDDPGSVPHDSTKRFISPAGTPILCSGPGRIWGTYSSGYGLSILVDHGNVNSSLGGVNTFYQHMESYSRAWQKGDSVSAGTVLGTMGYSHASADGEGLRHLHFELRFPRSGSDQDSWRIDPFPYMATWPKIAVGDAIESGGGPTEGTDPFGVPEPDAGSPEPSQLETSQDENVEAENPDDETHPVTAGVVLFVAFLLAAALIHWRIIPAPKVPT